MAQSRVELTLDSGHNLPASKHEPSLDRKDVELKELQRLYVSAQGERREALRHEIKKLTGDAALRLSPEAKSRDLSSGTTLQQRSSTGGLAADRPRLEVGAALSSASASSSRKGSTRPWSARPMSARKQSVQVMKTIPELKQHVRPLSSKRYDGKQSAQAGGGSSSQRHDWDNVHLDDWNSAGKPTSERRRIDSLGSDASVCSNDSDNDLENLEVCNRPDERLWGSSYDARHSVRNVVEPSQSCWVSSGLYPQVIGLHFRRSRPLSKVHVFAAGARTLRLAWCTKSGNWADQSQTTTATPNKLTVAEFVFTLAAVPSSVIQASAIRLEILEGSNEFCIVRHLKLA